MSLVEIRLYIHSWINEKFFEPCLLERDLKAYVRIIDPFFTDSLQTFCTMSKDDSAP